MRDLSLAPRHVREFAHFCATFPVRLWMTALCAACALTWAFAIPANEDTATVEAYPVPAAEAATGQTS